MGASFFTVNEVQYNTLYSKLPAQEYKMETEAKRIEGYLTKQGAKVKNWKRVTLAVEDSDNLALVCFGRWCDEILQES